MNTQNTWKAAWRLMRRTKGLVLDHWADQFTSRRVFFAAFNAYYVRSQLDPLVATHEALVYLRKGHRHEHP